MKLVFITNYMNHHQVHLSDAFYSLLGEDYHFIETMEMLQWRKALGYPEFSSRDYIVRTYKDKNQLARAYKLIDEADVVIIGSAPESFIVNRIESGKLTFRYCERLFKSKPWYLTGPRGWIRLYNNHIRFRNKPLFMLCASAFTAKDVNRIGAYQNKCFKWGYFTKIVNSSTYLHENDSLSSSRLIQIMWCARFIKWKHPELPVKLAARLKHKGYCFNINMFGIGDEYEKTKLLARKLNVEDVVNFCGSRPNEEILREMYRHDIFLFTSDRNEGWGAVLNEAMSCGCSVVASNQIGAVPFLIQDGVNGLIFKSEDLDSLEEKVRELLDNCIRRKELSANAMKTMQEIWSPVTAANQFLKLVNAIQTNRYDLVPKSGPASIAY